MLGTKGILGTWHLDAKSRHSCKLQRVVVCKEGQQVTKPAAVGQCGIQEEKGWDAVRDGQAEAAELRGSAYPQRPGAPDPLELELKTVVSYPREMTGTKCSYPLRHLSSLRFIHVLEWLLVCVCDRFTRWQCGLAWGSPPVTANSLKAPPSCALFFRSAAIHLPKLPG